MGITNEELFQMTSKDLNRLLKQKGIPDSRRRKIRKHRRSKIPTHENLQNGKNRLNGKNRQNGESLQNGKNRHNGANRQNGENRQNRKNRQNGENQQNGENRQNRKNREINENCQNGKNSNKIDCDNDLRSQIEELKRLGHLQKLRIEEEIKRSFQLKQKLEALEEDKTCNNKKEII